MSQRGISTEGSVTHFMCHKTVYFQWKIPMFLYLPHKALQSIQSSPFLLGDSEWFIRIYAEDLSGDMALYIVNKRSRHALRASYSAAVLKADGSVFRSVCGIEVVGEDEDVFCCSDGVIIPRSKLLAAKDVVLPEGTLTVLVSVCILDKTDEAVAADAGCQTASSDGRFLSMSELCANENKIKELEEKLSTLSKDKEDIEFSLKRTDIENASCSLEIRSLIKEITELKNKLKLAYKENYIYETEITELKRNLVMANKEKHDCEEEIIKLKEKMILANTQKDDDKREIIESNEKLAMVNREKAECERDIPELKEKLAVANKEISIYKTELKRNLEVANKEKHDCEEEIIKLKEKMILANTQKDDDKREITESNKKLVVANKEKAECERELVNLKEKLAMENEEKEARVVKIKNTEQDVKQGATRLSQNLRELAPDCGECDVKITFGDKQYMVHGSVLSAKSEVFRRMLQQEDGARNSEDALNITKGDPAFFEDFLLFMYTGKLENVSLNNIIALYKIADHYKVEDLKKACTHFLACNMSTEFIMDVQRAIFFRGVAEISKTETNSFNNNEFFTN